MNLSSLTLPRFSRLALFALSIVAGSTSALQGRLNASLALELDAPFVAGTVSFLGGALVLGLIVASDRRHRIALGLVVRRVLRGQERWWLCAGGLLGSVMVAAQALAIPTVGVALFTVAAIAGQLQSGLLVDRVGLLAGPRLPMSRPRLIGAVLALAAIVVLLVPLDGSPSPLALLLLLPLLAGLLRGIQQPINARLGAVSGSIWAASLVNFLGGLLVLLVLTVVADLPRGISLPQLWDTEFWLLLGGPLGVVFIVTSVIAVPRIGVLAFGVLAVFGQIAGSLVIDAVTGLVSVVTGWQLLLGLSALILAVVLVFFGSRAVR